MMASLTSSRSWRLPGGREELRAVEVGGESSRRHRLALRSTAVSNYELANV